MASTQTSIRIAQVIGLGGAAWLSGNIASLSLLAIPGLQNSYTITKSQSQNAKLTPTTLSLLWHEIYDLGKAQNPPISAVIASSFAFLAYKSHDITSNNLPRNLYTLAALLTISIAPFTLLAMKGVNGRLIAHSEDTYQEVQDKESDEDVSVLLKKWVRLNSIRGLLPLLGGLAGVFAILA